MEEYMNRLQDYALYDISWNLSPEHAVTMYLEWGNNDWHSEYPPVGGMGVRGLSPASAQNVHLRYACARC